MKRLHTNIMASTACISGIALLCSLLISACSPKEDSPKGFILPPGDSMAGQTTFAALGCVNCHTVDGVSFTDSSRLFKPELIVPLGGSQPLAKTYGQLVTAIIHPNAAILQENKDYVDADGNSLMPDYTEVMTVEQMTDLVTFLQDHYDIEIPEYDPNFPTHLYGYP